MILIIFLKMISLS